MDEFLVSHGLLALFCLSFLAATIVPLGSEWLLAALLINGHEQTMAVMTATIGNTLGALTTYGLGIWGGPFVLSSILRMKDMDRLRAEMLYKRYGAWTLLLSWMPVIGDPLCLAGGILRVPPVQFIALVFCGKLARYVVIGMLTVQVIQFSTG